MQAKIDHKWFLPIL